MSAAVRVEKEHALLPSPCSTPPHPPTLLCRISHILRLTLIAFIDGSVGLWNWFHRRCEWKSAAGHTETIFDCTYSPVDSNLLATASYDGTVVVWDTATMTVMYTMYTEESLYETSTKTTIIERNMSNTDFGCVLYAVTWSPDGQELAACSIHGVVYIFKLGKAKAIRSFNMHNSACYKVDWFPGQIPDSDSLLASSGRDCVAVAFDKEGTERVRFNFDQPCFGCHWSPDLRGMHGDEHALLAVGCQDNCAYICKVPLQSVNGSDISRTSERRGSGFGSRSSPARGAASGLAGPLSRPIVKLQGHSGRVFHVCWSPLVQGLLATGSDDATVRVWNIDEALETAVTG